VVTDWEYRRIDTISSGPEATSFRCKMRAAQKAGNWSQSRATILRI
jgi:hypothetical protein